MQVVYNPNICRTVTECLENRMLSKNSETIFAKLWIISEPYKPNLFSNLAVPKHYWVKPSGLNINTEAKVFWIWSFKDVAGVVYFQRRFKTTQIKKKGTFPGEIQICVFKGHHHNIRGLEYNTLHDVFFPGAYAQLRVLSVGCIQHQVTLEKKYHELGWSNRK